MEDSCVMVIGEGNEDLWDPDDIIEYQFEGDDGDIETLRVFG